MFKAMIIAGLGGFIGTCLRFLTGKLAHVITVSAFRNTGSISAFTSA